MHWHTKFMTFFIMDKDRSKAHAYTTLPNALTLFRIMVIPIVIILFYWESDVGSWLAALFFTLACVSDYLDGYLARRLRQETPFGVFLDPVADKLLVCATLLMLAGFHRIHGLALIAAVVILCREILILSLREFLAQTAGSMPVSVLAKWKTTLQMCAIGFLILGDPFPQWLPLPIIATTALWFAAILTFITGYDYLRQGIHKIIHEHHNY